MSQFNSTCIAQLHTSACSEHIKHSFSVICKTFLVATIVSVLFVLINVIRRSCVMPKHGSMFKIIAPQLLIWGMLQIFYHSIRGFSPNNFGVPTVMLSMANLTSQSILGSTVLKLVIVSISIHHTATNFHPNSYLNPYWLMVGSFLMLTMLSSGLAGIDPRRYYIAMRITLIIWIIYLLTCLVLLLVYGIQVYLDTGKSKERDANVKQVRHNLPKMLSLYSVIFVTTLLGFIFYASATELIERSRFWQLLIWTTFWTCSIVYVNIWNIYWWRTTIIP